MAEAFACRSDPNANASALESPGRIQEMASHFESHSVRGTNGSGGGATLWAVNVA